MRRYPVPMSLAPLLFAAALVVIAAAPAAAADPKAAPPGAGASTPAERQARGEEAAKAFMLGRYDEALATYLDLYIKSNQRLEYLRNIGRCQQKLKQYDRATESFKEYLRRGGKHLSADERKEIQGFITEMETAQANERGGAGTQPPPPPAFTQAPPAVVAPPPPPPASEPPPAPVATQPVPPPPPAQAQPVGAPPPAYGQPTPGAETPPPGYGPPPGAPAYQPAHPGQPAPVLVGQPVKPVRKSSGLRKGGIALAIVGAVFLVIATTALVESKAAYDSAKKDDACGTSGGTSSVCNTDADLVSAWNAVSKVSYVIGGVLGAGGVAMIVAGSASSPKEPPRVGLSKTWTF